MSVIKKYLSDIVFAVAILVIVATLTGLFGRPASSQEPEPVIGVVMQRFVCTEAAAASALQAATLSEKMIVETIIAHGPAGECKFFGELQRLGIVRVAMGPATDYQGDDCFVYEVRVSDPKGRRWFALGWPGFNVGLFDRPAEQTL